MSYSELSIEERAIIQVSRIQGMSLRQIAGKLKYMTIPDLRDAYVCRETIYDAIYALPVVDCVRN